MPNATRFLVAALSIASACGAPDKRPARNASPLIGTWLMRSIETTDSAGRTIETSHPAGIIIYTPEGRMAVQIMVSPRPSVPAVPEGPDQVTAWSGEQARRVVETYDAYFGTYTVDEVKHVVTHHVEGELRPNYVGAAYRRAYDVQGDRLILSSTNPAEPWRVVWERARQAGD